VVSIIYIYLSLVICPSQSTTIEFRFVCFRQEVRWMKYCSSKSNFFFVLHCIAMQRFASRCILPLFVQSNASRDCWVNGIQNSFTCIHHSYHSCHQQKSEHCLWMWWRTKSQKGKTWIQDVVECEGKERPIAWQALRQLSSPLLEQARYHHTSQTWT